ncbi:MAG: CheR family methyltransferase [Elusimicrobiota bacterium]
MRNKEKDKNNSNREEADFPVVGIGSSAGGLEALNSFMDNMPEKVGMGIVLIPHLSPDKESLMHDIIQKHTSMETLQAEDNMRVEPDKVYVIPPGKKMTLFNGKLQLAEQGEEEKHRAKHTIDNFFRSLASDKKDKAIGIVLSGTGSEGALGAKKIKGNGGLVLVQSLDSAQYTSMPDAAISTGVADYVISPEAMPGKLVDYSRGMDVIKAPTEDLSKKKGHLNKIFMVLQKNTGNDFSKYKRTSVIRRLEKRMSVNGITEIEDYVKYLKENDSEVRALYRDLLIGVTSFFREPEAFEFLKKSVLPEIFEDKPNNDTLRVWIPGCATGEEAYSLAIIILEYMETIEKTYKIQLFASDINEEFLEKARKGIYPETISADVSRERLKKFFDKRKNSYRIKNSVREKIVFALQNVLEDPPFSRLDIISCRNLMIYLSSELQRKALNIFSFSLNRGGILFVGSSESIGKSTDLFSVVNKKWKIYENKDTADYMDLPTVPHILKRNGRDYDFEEKDKTSPKNEVQDIVEDTILREFAPPALIISREHEILYIHGDVEKYLHIPEGKVNMDVTNLVREDIKFELNKLVMDSLSGEKEKYTESGELKTENQVHSIKLTIRRIDKSFTEKELYLVVFEDRGKIRQSKDKKEGKEKEKEDKKYKYLEKRVLEYQKKLGKLKSEHESSREKMQAMNEELQSTNEELQSTNEELETSKEELQSLNEELVTVNSELQDKIDDLAEVNNDLNNLINSTDIAVLFLDSDLSIRRFTPRAKDVANLREGDLGRPLSDISLNVEYREIYGDVRQVIDSLKSIQKEIKGEGGEWYSVRLTPYRTVDNVIEGAVVVFTDITELKKSEIEAEKKREYTESIIETLRESILVLDKDLRVVSANKTFYETFKTTGKETVGKKIDELGDGQWNIPALKKLLNHILPEKNKVDDFEVEHNFPEIGRKKMVLNARKMEDPFDRDEKELIFLAIEDITSVKGNFDER